MKKNNRVPYGWYFVHNGQRTIMYHMDGIFYEIKHTYETNKAQFLSDAGNPTNFQGRCSTQITMKNR